MQTEPTSETETAEDVKPSRMSKHPFRFSMGSFILWITVISLTLGNIITASYLLRSNRELKRAERQTGFLVYDDRSKVHASRVPIPGRHVWQFRIFLPGRQQYELFRRINGIPESGFPEAESDVIYVPNSGAEYLITIRMERDYQDRWQLYREFVSVAKSGGFSGSLGGGIEALPEDCEWVNAYPVAHFGSSAYLKGDRRGDLLPSLYRYEVEGVPQAGSHGHDTFAADETVELLRVRTTQLDADPRDFEKFTPEDFIALEESAEFPSEADGIMFWIEPRL